MTPSTFVTERSPRGCFRRPLDGSTCTPVTRDGVAAVGHGNDAYFWTDRYESPPTCVGDELDAAGARGGAGAPTEAAADVQPRRELRGGCQPPMWAVSLFEDFLCESYWKFDIRFRRA